MDSDEAPPPPYSAVDPLLAPSNRSNTRNANSSSTANPSLLHLRGGEAQLHLHAQGSASLLASAALPTHFTSAAAYFADRPPPAVEDAEQTLEHHMTIYPRSQAKDFRRRPRCWSPRMSNVAQQDWDMFLRHLFPPHLGLASSSVELSRQVRAEIRRDRKDRPQETDEERERRVAAVIKEWNQFFFELRAVRVVFFYVSDPRNAPASPLCPRCYPAATRVSQGSRTVQTPEAGRGHPLPVNMYPAAAGYPQAPMWPGQAPAPYGYPAPGPTPYPPQPSSGFYHPANPHVYQAPYPQYQPWGWGNQYPQQYESSSSKGGPLGWFSSLAAQAQKYGDRITEQAQHYGRQVEEQALAHGRWIEEQAGLSSRKVETTYTGWGAPQGYNPYYYPQVQPQPQPQPQQQPQPQPTPITATPSPAPTQTTPIQPQQTPRQLPAPAPTQQQQQQQPPPRRRDSISSVSSDSSLSSIDSISTTSELSSSDLATVRAQLLSLDAHHDRPLYDAAVELRRQLDAVRESRRQARVSSSSRPGRWRTGLSFGQSRNHESSSTSSGQGRSGSSWGRWESPQDRQRNAAERRAAKDELRATRKAFRDVFKRARDEQRERRRMKKVRRRQERRARREAQDQGQGQSAVEAAPVPVPLPESVPAPASAPAPEPEQSLEQRLQDLELENRQNRAAPSQNRTTAETSNQRADADADAGSESSAVSSIRTPSVSSDEGEDTNKEKGKKRGRKPSHGN